MEIISYHRPTSLDEAYDLMVKQGATPLAGGAWTLTSRKSLASGVDLSELGLRFIKTEGEYVVIGAMTTARDMETSELLAEIFGPLFARALGGIAGVQIRTIVTAGGNVAGRYGFSELLVLLLALDASLVFYKNGTKSLASYLDSPPGGAFLLEKILIPRDAKAAYQCLRQAANDFPVLSVCAARSKAGWRIAVGARPKAAALSLKAGSFLTGAENPDEVSSRKAGLLAAEELSFGDDLRASAEYRRSVCPVLVTRAIGGCAYDA
ncbi:MAG: FAD binding domain-containing protein [Spirochaetia bacterium]|jgi:CO/xanthine dehydrogenase FAD-binding subunit|nr:FAD binding domain-containing protein [Spirochaetia bacterium]